MNLNKERTEKFLHDRGWSEVIFARMLDLDYSYVYRVMRGERGVGKKFIGGLMRLCEKEGLDFKDFVILD